MDFEQLVKFGEKTVERHLKDLSQLKSGNLKFVESAYGRFSYTDYTKWRSRIINYIKEQDGYFALQLENLFSSFESGFSQESFSEVMAKLYVAVDKFNNEDKTNDKKESHEDVVLKNIDINVSLEGLIKEGESIASSLKINKPQTPFDRPTYSFEDENTFLLWKELCKRFVASYYNDDIVYETLNELFKRFDDESNNNKKTIHEIIALFKALIMCPQKVVINSERKNDQSSGNSISIFNIMNQSMSFQIVQSITNSLSKEQINELRKIIESGKDEESKKKSLKEKFISFGRDLAPSILANIMTNPQIWGALF